MEKAPVFNRLAVDPEGGHVCPRDGRRGQRRPFGPGDDLRRKLDRLADVAG
jgi:hypothetical protein